MNETNTMRYPNTMTLSFHHSLPIISEEELSWLEAQFNLTLPPDYRKFILAVNGGYPNKAYFFSNSGPVNIQEFYGVFPDLKVSCHQNIFENYQHSPNPEFLTIGYNEADKCSLELSLRTKDFGAVYQINEFETMAIYQEDSQDGLEYLFPNFQTLLNSACYYHELNSLYIPIRNNDLKKVKALLNQGWDPQELIDDVHHPLDIAFENDLIDMARFLWEQGARENDSLEFREVRSLDGLQFLLDIGLNIQSEPSALMVQAARGRLDLVNRFIELGADIHHRSKFGTPLSFAIDSLQKLEAQTFLYQGEEQEAENIKSVISHLKALG